MSENDRKQLGVCIVGPELPRRPYLGPRRGDIDRDIDRDVGTIAISKVCDGL
jgi:hypothetical protein